MDSTRKPLIAIFGHTGMVGSTIFKYYSQRKFQVIGRSLDNESAEFEEKLPQAAYVFICVPTPWDWKKQQYDLSIVNEVLDCLVDKAAYTDPAQIVILKSTVLPGTTKKLQKDYSELKIVFNPEFLSEATADADFANPDRQLVGCTQDSYSRGMDVLNILPNSPYDVIVSSTEAEIAKYVNNFHGALMVIFANLINDICIKAGASYEVVKKASQASKWVGSPMGRMYWNINQGGYRGYGGPCFPKDTNSLLKWANKKGIQCEILGATIKANKRILRSQGLNEQKVEKISNRVVNR